MGKGKDRSARRGCPLGHPQSHMGQLPCAAHPPFSNETWCTIVICWVQRGCIEVGPIDPFVPWKWALANTVRTVRTGIYICAWVLRLAGDAWALVSASARTQFGTQAALYQFLASCVLGSHPPADQDGRANWPRGSIEFPVHGRSSGRYSFCEARRWEMIL